MANAFLVFSFLVMVYLCRRDIVNVCKLLTADDFKWIDWTNLVPIAWLLAKIFLVPLGIRAIYAPAYYVVYVAVTAFLVYRYIKKMPKRNKVKDGVSDDKHDEPSSEGSEES